MESPGLRRLAGGIGDSKEKDLVGEGDMTSGSGAESPPREQMGQTA